MVLCHPTFDLSKSDIRLANIGLVKIRQIQLDIILAQVSEELIKKDGGD